MLNLSLPQEGAVASAVALGFVLYSLALKLNLRLHISFPLNPTQLNMFAAPHSEDKWQTEFGVNKSLFKSNSR